MKIDEGSSPQETEEDLGGVQIARLKRDHDASNSGQPEVDDRSQKGQKLWQKLSKTVRSGHGRSGQSGHGFVCAPPSLREYGSETGGQGSKAERQPRRERNFWKERLHEDIVVCRRELNQTELLATLRGRLQVVDSPRRAIRVFISSTFTDTAGERNLLLHDVFPYLDEYARKHGYLFQGSEMRWGIREYAAKENMTSDMCLQEIRACQDSVGVNFVLLSTQKYGYQPLPRRIDMTIFDRVLEFADTNEKLALSRHYCLDVNSLEPEYVLEMSHLSQQEWSKMESVLREILKTCSLRAWPDLDICDPACNHPAKDFFISVTEMEITQGILQQPDSKEKCLIFTRTISNLSALASSENPSSTNVGHYIDMTGDGQVSSQAQERLEWYKTRMLPSVCSLDCLNHWVRKKHCLLLLLSSFLVCKCAYREILKSK